MASLYRPGVSVRIIVELPEGSRDAIFMPLDEYIEAHEAVIDQRVRDRRETWIANRDAPKPPPVEPTKEDLEAQLAVLDAQELEITRLKTEARAKLDRGEHKPPDPKDELEVEIKR